MHQEIFKSSISESQNSPFKIIYSITPPEQNKNKNIQKLIPKSVYKKSIQNGFRRIFEETLNATFVQIKVRSVSNLVKCMFIVFADKG